MGKIKKGGKSKAVKKPSNKNFIKINYPLFVFEL